MLENLEHEGKSCFVTLTYAGCPTDLDPSHTQRWLKRLRKALNVREPTRLRYHLVGEYGENTQRPHYHAALFGLRPCIGGPVIKGVCQCLTCSDVRETWGYGHVHVGTLTRESAQYIAGYVTKKMTQRDDPRLNGRHPEFARMSLRPGIGATAMWNVASALMQYNLEYKGDVPAVLDHSHRSYPLGRYLRSKLRTYVGKDATSIPQLEELAEKVRLVREAAFNSDLSTKEAFYQLNKPYADTLGVVEKMKGRKL